MKDLNQNWYWGYKKVYYMQKLNCTQMGKIGKVKKFL